ncbi:acyl-CoA synthetase FdrA [Neobacillus drentensis]|uniref:acyl-CoA synthetase FdrA n=1 Tax=Neobacillus drentensis TaxID=220684 RepID=UPI002FFDB9BE
MPIKVVFKKNTYIDSVSLMTLSNRASDIEGVEQAMIAMGTDMNKEVIKNIGLNSPEIEGANSGDLMIVVKASTEELCESAFIQIEELFTKKAKPKEAGEVKYPTISSAAKSIPEANLAVISVSGAYAAREARKALDNDLHVMLFSDNISLEDEIQLKNLAHEKGLLLMGPDCGTAIISDVALCFANAVRKGNIGIVGASGTGSQEVTVLIHNLGGGITQLIGTGGRDLSEEVGGIMMLDGIRALEKDPATEVIVLVSKPPHPTVEKKVLEEIKNCTKPVVVCFMGGKKDAAVEAGGHFAKTTEEAAFKAIELAGIQNSHFNKSELNLKLVKEVRAKLNPEQKYIRGLFSGGTLCDEAMHAAMEKFDDVYSNIQRDPKFRLKDSKISEGHTFIDFGDDQFTQGKPHPMIDTSTRLARFQQEAKDPSVGVIVMDFVLGFGAHEDPAGAFLPAIIEAKQLAEEEGRHLEVVGYVLGTELDSQNIEEQKDKLVAAGVTLASSNANAGLLASEFVVKGA